MYPYLTSGSPFWNEGLQGAFSSPESTVFSMPVNWKLPDAGGKAGNRTYGTGCGRGACGLLLAEKSACNRFRSHQCGLEDKGCYQQRRNWRTYLCHCGKRS